MKKPAELGAIDIAAVQSRMLTIRNQQVLLDRDVAALYGVQTKEINQAIRNNPGKFPEGFVFQLNEQEFGNWKSKILTSKTRKGYMFPVVAEFATTTVDGGLVKVPIWHLKRKVRHFAVERRNGGCAMRG